MPQTLLAVLDKDVEFAKVRMFGVFGRCIIFPRDGELISHVTTSQNYKRVNPLDAKNFEGAELLTRVFGMKPFLNSFLTQSIWFQPSGDIHFRQRELFLGFVTKFLTEEAQREIYSLSSEALRERIECNGDTVDLFDLLQEVVSIVQLHFISDYRLPDSWTIEEYCSITNSAFGGMYSFTSPSAHQQAGLVSLTSDMLENSGPKGLVRHMRRHASSDLPDAQREQELLHNLMAGLFLGQQSLANAAYWAVRRLFGSPALLKQVRADEQLLPSLIKEEMRVHPPSSPLLMPFLNCQRDVYKGTVIEEGSIVAVVPILLHLNDDVWPDSAFFKPARFDAEVAERRASFQGSHQHRESKGAVPVEDVYAAMAQKGEDCQNSGSRCPMAKTDATSKTQSERYCPFGVGRARCPMMGFSIGVVMNLMCAIMRDWEVDLHDDFDLPVSDHVLVDTGSRPVVRIKAMFSDRQSI